jgi:two-component system sensor histidine kinase CiaH
MIKALKKKFILVSMGSLLLVLITVIGLVYGAVSYQLNQSNDYVLNLLAENGGTFPEWQHVEAGVASRRILGLDILNINSETPFSSRYFSVTFQNDGTIASDLTHISNITAREAVEDAQKAVASGRDSAYYDSYKYLIHYSDNGTQVIFLSCTDNEQTQTLLLIIGACTGAACLIIMFIIITLTAGKAVEPFVKNMERQKQFITNASHELKTPLAIICANADVLEIEVGEENQWLNSIRGQTMRMNHLIQEMLALARADEDMKERPFAAFDMSAAVAESAEPFETMAKSQEKTLDIAIETGLILKGNREDIGRLTDILLENAIKYTEPGGAVSLSLKKQGRSRVLTVTNPSSALPQEDLDRLFDRFYRSDKSRNRSTGGFGIGLSIAAAIVAAHHGKITAKMADDTHICFQVIL